MSTATAASTSELSKPEAALDGTWLSEVNESTVPPVRPSQGRGSLGAGNLIENAVGAAVASARSSASTVTSHSDSSNLNHRIVGSSTSVISLSSSESGLDWGAEERISEWQQSMASVSPPGSSQQPFTGNRSRSSTFDSETSWGSQASGNNQWQQQRLHHQHQQQQQMQFQQLQHHHHQFDNQATHRSMQSDMSGPANDALLMKAYVSVSAGLRKFVVTLRGCGDLESAQQLEEVVTEMSRKQSSLIQKLNLPSTPQSRGL